MLVFCIVNLHLIVVGLGRPLMPNELIEDIWDVYLFFLGLFRYELNVQCEFILKVIKIINKNFEFSF